LNVADHVGDGALQRQAIDSIQVTTATPHQSRRNRMGLFSGQQPSAFQRRRTVVREDSLSSAAPLGAHGLVRGSFVPPEPIRQLQDLTATHRTSAR
jgi:hypothetical protein